jgi:SOS-response transcriptional repressor LexA
MAKHTERPALTGRQALVLAFVQTHTQTVGYPPTLREIGGHMGIRSTNGVNDHLVALERKGYIVRESLKSRSIRVVPQSPDDERLVEQLDDPMRRALQSWPDEGRRAQWIREHLLPALREAKLIPAIEGDR